MVLWSCLTCDLTFMWDEQPSAAFYCDDCVAQVRDLAHCECDNGHEQNDTVCRWCWVRGRRHWNDPDVPGDAPLVDEVEAVE